MYRTTNANFKLFSPHIKKTSPQISRIHKQSEDSTTMPAALCRRHFYCHKFAGMKLKNRNVLITGGASGIGRIMGRIALEKGARTFIIWDINITSAGGMLSNPRMSVYAASKWGATGWSYSVRIELQDTKKAMSTSPQWHLISSRPECLKESDLQSFLFSNQNGYPKE